MTLLAVPRGAVLLVVALVMLPMPLLSAGEEIHPLRAMLRDGKFRSVELAVRSALARSPQDVELLSYLETALNGLRRRRSAKKIGAEVRKAWARTGTEESRARSREKWLRMVVISKRFTVEAFEYFVPENLGPEGIAVYYELVAMPNGAGMANKLSSISTLSSILSISNTRLRVYHWVSM